MVLEESPAPEVVLMSQAPVFSQPARSGNPNGSATDQPVAGQTHPSAWSGLDRGTLAAGLKLRRQRLAEQVDGPVILWSGKSQPRNFAANTYPFRPSSHFLYFAGFPLENAAIYLEAGKLELFMDNPAPEDEIWHGPSADRDQMATWMGADAAFPLAELAEQAGGAATLPVQGSEILHQQQAILGRSLPSGANLQGMDLVLAEAIVQLRLRHDALAVEQLRWAGQVTMQAHRAGMAATGQARTEAAVRAAMEKVLLAQNFTTAYNSIVTIQGEVLHNQQYHHELQPGDLLLADLGGETPWGWAADITRTWPVSGRFSPSQQAIYEVVRSAHDTAIAALKPGVEYRQIHLQAAEVIAAGLVDLGILNGDPQTLVERDVHALFFPHGIGHLLGLDVHDMEDLGDLAGYATGRNRSDRFGLCYLRLDRPLQAGMVVTIEPGFYQIPGLLQDKHRREQYRDAVNWERLVQFADVRGIRIEDDVLITETGAEILTADLPTEPAALEALVQHA